MGIWIKRLSLLLALGGLGSLYSIHVFAIDLQTAKAQGLVGETTSGYLGAPGSPSAEVRSLISDINSKRKAEYQKVAQKVGKPLKVIEQLAGKKAISKTRSGYYVQDSQGNWKKKP